MSGFTREIYLYHRAKLRFYVKKRVDTTTKLSVDLAQRHCFIIVKNTFICKKKKIN